jgi:hypothetical protein
MCQLNFDFLCIFSKNPVEVCSFINLCMQLNMPIIMKLSQYTGPLITKDYLSTSSETIT